MLLLCLVIGPGVGCQPSYSTAGLIDDSGREITLDTIPQRIISHVPPITEILFALGLGDRVVGVSDFCDYPEAAQTKASIGDYYNPSIEKIVALEPDLVLTDGHSDSIDGLEGLGIPRVVIDPQDFDGIFRDIELLGQITGVAEIARQVIDDMEQAISGVVDQVAGKDRPRVLYIIDATDLSLPWTAGPGSFIDYLINMAGGDNVAAAAESAWVQLSIEEVVNVDPEIIIVPTAHGTAFTTLEVLQEHPGWRETTAIRQGAVYTIDGDLVDGYGPRIVEGLAVIAGIIHPELFP